MFCCDGHGKQRRQKIVMEKSPEVLGKILFYGQLDLAINQSKLKVEDKLEEGDRRVLIIHTGGTIGMFSSIHGYRPERNKFFQFLKKYPYFCDAEFTAQKGNNQFIITPPSIYGKRVWFRLHEMVQLIDSSNMNIDYWNMLLKVLEQVYHKYDAFIILHGTDSMCFTASMLSFMIQNLNKTIVITGAQIPISETNNDSINNLLCSLFVAGHFKIPEVLIVFDDLLLRGNRSKKRSTSEISSFYSPNFPPLAKFGLVFDISWNNILTVEDESAEVKFIAFDKEITTIKLTPYSHSIPTSKYVIIESYGCGNFPLEGPIFEWLTSNSEMPEEERQIILNISQVQSSCVVTSYEAGMLATRLGVLMGTDMTVECATAKLMYLVTKGFSFAEMNQKIGQAMRGQLTELTEGEESIISGLWNEFQNKTQEQKNILLNIVLPRIAIQAQFTLPLISKLFEYGYKVNTLDFHKRNILHLICMYPRYDREDSVWLLKKQGLDINALDDESNSSLFYAIINNKPNITRSLWQYHGVLKMHPRYMFQRIREGDIKTLELFHRFGEKFQQLNAQKRNVGIEAAISSRQNVLDFLRDKTNFLNSVVASKKDVYQKDLDFYLSHFKIK